MDTELIALYTRNQIDMNVIFKTIIISGLIMITACSHNAESLTEAQNNEIVKEVEASFGELIAAAKTLQAEPYLALFDAELFTALNEDGTVTHSLGEFAERYTQGIAHIKSYASLEFSNVKIMPINHTTAILVNEYKAGFILTSGEAITVAGAGTQVWSRRKDEWKLVHVASSAKP